MPGDSRLDPGKDGGTFTGAWVGPCCVGVDNLNPFETSNGDANFSHLIYEHLVTFSVVPDTVATNPYSGSYGPLAPELADSWEVSADHLTWTFHLHPGTKWHDGTDFTSADVKFSFEACLDPKVGVCYAGGSMTTIKGAADVTGGKTLELSGVQAPDPNTITITTATPNAILPYNVMELYIVQKATVGAIPREEVQKSTIWSTPGKAIGTGPFKVTGYTPGQSEELSRFDEYHRAKPHLERIIRREFKDAGSAILAFDKGEIDYTYLTADEVPREQSSTNGTILPGPSGVDLNLVLNPLKNKEWADPRVHQALLYAIDRNSILKNIYHIDDPHPLNCLYKDPTLNPPDVAVYDYNPDKAKQLLADAGIDPAKWGEVVFDTYYQDQGSLDAMTAIQSNLAAIGMKVKIQQMDSASWSKRYYDDGVSELSLIGGDGGLPSNGYGYGSLHSSSAWPKGGNGWKGYSYSNPALDKLFDTLLTQFDPAEQTTTLQAICKMDAEYDVPYMNLWATTRYWFVNNRIGNFVSTPGPAGGNYYAAAETWYAKS
jgi:peptide/nickel transport system substrate-binding protein